MRCRPEHYFAAARERFTQSVLLRRESQYALAMYISGLSAECMVRSFHTVGEVFDERHDIIELFKGCAWRFDGAVRRKLHAALNTVHTYWDNAYRFADEQRVRNHLRSLKRDRTGIHKNADILKVRCTELENASGEIIQIGEETWRKRA